MAAFGAPSVLTVAPLKWAPPAANHVLVRLFAAGVNPVDVSSYFLSFFLEKIEKNSDGERLKLKTKRKRSDERNGAKALDRAKESRRHKKGKR